MPPTNPPPNLRLRTSFRYKALDFVSITVAPESAGFVALMPKPSQEIPTILAKVAELRGDEQNVAALLKPTADGLVVVDVMLGSAWPNSEDLTIFINAQEDPSLPPGPIVVPT
jgi:hypothetical protein